MRRTVTTRFYSAGRAIVDALGLRRSRAGRKVVAALNALGAYGIGAFTGPDPATIDGFKMALADRHHPSPGFAGNLLEGCYEPGTKELLATLLRPGMIVLDVGAHVGYYTLLAARMVGPHGRVYAFEPEPENYALLAKNVALNGFSNVRLVPKAAMATSGTASLFISAQGNDRHSVFPNPRSLRRETSREVACVALDDFLQAEGWPPVDLVKLDIEGAEPLALDGMGRLLAQAAGPKLIVEFAPETLQNGGTSPQGFLEKLNTLGLAVSTIQSDGGLSKVEVDKVTTLVVETKRRGVVNLFCEKRRPLAM